MTQVQDTHRARRVEGPQLIVRPEISPTIMRMLERDRMPDDWIAGAGRDVVIDGLLTSIKAGEAIDLATPRSLAEAEHDGESPTVGGYLRALVRDVYNTHGINADWHELGAVGALGFDIEAACGSAVLTDEQRDGSILEMVIESAFNRQLVAELALDDDQRDGLACIRCGSESGPMRPVVGSSPLLFAHDDCARA